MTSSQQPKPVLSTAEGPRRRSSAGLYVTIAAFFFFALCGPAGYVALLRPWEHAPPPPPPPPPDGGTDAGQDAGPPIPEVIAYHGALDRTEELAFGGVPYCNYASFFSQISVDLTTQGIDAQGHAIVTGGTVSATYNERTTSRRCPYPPTPVNPHALAFASFEYAGNEAVIQFNAQSGQPATRATLRGTFGAGTFDGSLELHRNDGFAPVLQFAFSVAMHLDRAPTP